MYRYAPKNKTKEEWHSEIINTLTNMLAISKNRDMIQKHIHFFERNKDKLSVFEYEYYCFNFIHGIQTMQKEHTENMMKVIDEQEMITLNEVSQDVDTLLMNIKHSQLDSIMTQVLNQ